MGVNLRYPGSGETACSFACVIVSPTWMVSIFLMAAVKKPTSPVARNSLDSSLGVKTPKSMISYSAFVAIILILSPLRMMPLTIRIKGITPRYAS